MAPKEPVGTTETSVALAAPEKFDILNEEDLLARHGRNAINPDHCQGGVIGIAMWMEEISFPDGSPRWDSRERYYVYRGDELPPEEGQWVRSCDSLPTNPQGTTQGTLERENR